MDETQFKVFDKTIRHWMKKYCKNYTLQYSNLMTRNHGITYTRRKIIRLSMYAISQGLYEDMLRTALHEIAHAIVSHGSGEPSHGPKWRRIYYEICHNENINPLDNPDSNPQYASFRIVKDFGYMKVFKDVKTPTKISGHYWWECVVCSQSSAKRTTQPKNAPLNVTIAVVQ